MSINSENKPNSRARPHHLKVLDLFCGAGGMSFGFIDAGFDLVGAVDNFPAALETHTCNVGGGAIALDLASEENINNLPTSTVIVGGPPCQGFSSAGLRRAADARNSLVGCFAQIIVRKRPLAFVFENVEGFLTAEGGWHVTELLRPLLAAGYHIHLRKINAANYGVPQHRKRVIAIGGLGWDPTFPAITHSAFGAPGAELASRHLPQTPTLTDALANLPQAKPTPPGDLPGHVYRPLTGIDLERARALKPGQSMRDLPEALQHDSFRRRAFRRVLDGTPTERRGGAPFGIRRLRGDQPSKAITGGARNEFLHPSEDRPLTIRECARLQTFPDNFTFRGTQAEQAQLIGNAVPPRLARCIADSLAADLVNQAALARSVPAAQGRLLSFVPTLSEGLSPALRLVTDRIHAEYMNSEPTLELSLWL